PIAGGLREGDGALSQGLTRVFAAGARLLPGIFLRPDAPASHFSGRQILLFVAESRSAIHSPHPMRHPSTQLLGTSASRLALVPPCHGSDEGSARQRRIPLLPSPQAGRVAGATPILTSGIMIE